MSLHTPEILRFFRKVKWQTWIAIAIVCVAAIFFSYRQHTLLEHIQENVLYFLDPTAERAFSYGLRHFDALDPKEYDVRRANYFFSEAAAIDPKYPLVHHELARIAFLSGDFPRALGFINTEFIANPKPDPSSYYVRALIEGYMNDYASAAADYETYFKVAPVNWAALNDYSWVLLKLNFPDAAHQALSFGLKQWPDNAWLLANDATALYELGRFSEAATVAKKAVPAVQALTVDDWLIAYPGNDPLIAQTGLDNFKKTTQENLAKILAKSK